MAKTILYHGSYCIVQKPNLSLCNMDKRSGADPLEVIADFMESDTAKILYDKETGLWENGPDYIANEYEQEKALKAS